MLHKTINTLTAALFAAVCGAQMLNARGLIAAGQSQDSAATPAQSSPAQPPAEPAAADAEHKKAKKVWTNENLGDAHGTVSQVGVAKPAEMGKPVTPKSSDAKLITSFRKQLATLEAQTDGGFKQTDRGFEEFWQGRAHECEWAGIAQALHHGVRGRAGPQLRRKEKRASSADRRGFRSGPEEGH